MADKLASTGLMVVVPDLFLGKPVSSRNRMKMLLYNLLPSGKMEFGAAAHRRKELA